MRLLLDTHVFLWWVEGRDDVSRKATRAIADAENECFVSVASCWEMAIKLSLGKLRLDAPLQEFVPEQMAANRFRLLPIDFRHVIGVAGLPFHHRDPFDRLLIAQAVCESMTIISADRTIKRYGVRRIW